MSDSKFTYIAHCAESGIIKVGTANDPFERVKAHRRRVFERGDSPEYMTIVAYFSSEDMSERNLIQIFADLATRVKTREGVVLREWFYDDGGNGPLLDILRLLVLARGSAAGLAHDPSVFRPNVYREVAHAAH